MAYAHLLPITDYLPRYAFSRRAGWLPPDSIPLADYLLIRRVAIERDDGPIPYVMLQANVLNPYRTIDALLDGLPQLVERNLLDQDGDAYTLTSAGRDLLTRGEHEANDYAASRMHLSPEVLAHLAAILSSIAEQLQQASEPEVTAHQDRVPFLRRFDPRQTPPIHVEYAMYALQRARDDAHISAWHNAGLEGPEVELLSTLWNPGAMADGELIGLYRGRIRPDDVSKVVEGLQHKGYATSEAGMIRISDRGREVRNLIERETDRIYFSPWPSIDTDWLFEQLEALMTNLNPDAHP